MLPLALHTSVPQVVRGLRRSMVLGLGALALCSCMTPDFTFTRARGEADGNLELGVDCYNREMDSSESDVDCGGPCEPCPVGLACAIARDCEMPPAGDPSLVRCNGEGVCELECLANHADCNERASDGCETNLLSDENHCGACGSDCSLPHALGWCENGQCLIKTEEDNQGCAVGYADCNLDPKDGCETDLRRDPDHCGACEDAVCPSIDGEASCEAGECAIVCSSGYADCDDKVGNGCETPIGSSVAHCGTCGNRCSTSGPGWSAFCVEGQCGETECAPGAGDCDGDGSCMDELTTIDNCGQCGLTCNVANGTPSCDSATCQVAACDSDDEAAWADCDGDYETGCEVNTLSSPARCGGCLPSEGGNGENCSVIEGQHHVTVTACGMGECVIVGCDSGWADCDGEFENGCEENTDSSETNCGGCAGNGGQLCSVKPNALSECSAGTCSYSCSAGWSDADNDRYEADSNGCESRSLRVVGMGEWGSSDTGGSGPAVTIDHTLKGVKGTGRLLVVGVICRAEPATILQECDLIKAEYGSTHLHFLDQVVLENSAAQLYYLLDDELPAAGIHRITLDKGDNWGSLSAEAVEFSGAEQDMAFYAQLLEDSSPEACASSADTSFQFSDLPAQSILYVVGGGTRDAQPPGVATRYPLSVSQSRSEDYILFGSALSDPVAGDVSAALDLGGCSTSVMMAVAVRPGADY